MVRVDRRGPAAERVAVSEAARHAGRAAAAFVVRDDALGVAALGDALRRLHAVLVQAAKTAAAFRRALAARKAATACAWVPKRSMNERAPISTMFRNVLCVCAVAQNTLLTGAE